MLSLAAPLALGFLAAGLLAAFFYFLRMRFRRQPVSSTFLWHRLVQVNEGGSRLRWRSLLLLVLQLLAITALVLALAGPLWTTSAPRLPGTLYVLDTSASMKAREPGQERTRMQRAGEAVLADYKDQTDNTPVAVFAGSSQLFESADGAGLEAYLNSVTAGDGAFLEKEAAETLEAWVQTHPGVWSGVLASDGGVDQGGSRLAKVFGGRWRSLPFAQEAPNLGITDLRLAAVPRPQARITVFNGFEEPRKVTLTLSREGSPVAQREETLAAGTVVLEWNLSDPGAERALWRVRIENHADALAADDEFLFEAEPSRRVRVLQFGAADPFLRAAFPGAEFAPQAPWDLVVAEDRLPPGWKGNLVTFGVLPPEAPVFWGPEVSGVVSGSGTHHLARWVPWNSVTVRAGRGLVVQPGATVLAEAGGWPIAATWEKEGARFLVLGFDTRGSNLGLTPVLPVLMHNLRQALVPQEDNPLATSLRVGKPALRAGGDGWKVASASAAATALEAVRRGTLWELTARQAGTFTWVDGDETGVLVSHLPAGESDTAPRALATAEAQPTTPPTLYQVQILPLGLGLILAALVFLVLEWRLWNGRFSPRANPNLAILRTASLAAAFLVLVGLALPWPTADRNLTLLFDTSASLGPELIEQERQSALRFLDRLAPSDRVALLSFAGVPKVLSGLLPRDQARTALESARLASAGSEEGTDIGAGLAAGAQLLTGEPGTSSQLVFSDGRANIGGGPDDWVGAARRFPVSAVPVGRQAGGVTALGLEAPAARPREKALVRWQAWTDQPRVVTLTLAVDAVVQETRTLELSPGTTSADFFVASGEAGTRILEVAVTDTQGPLPSAGASGFLTVEGQASILVIRGPGSLTALSQALQKQGLPVVVRNPEGLPATAGGYQEFSAVVLDNVPAPSLTLEQQRQLRDWVAGGGGLLVIGGSSSLGRGEYYTSLLEDLLPVQTDNRQRLQFTRSRLLFVVDHSGSMSEDVGETSKLQAAVGGVAASIEELTPQDEVGILQFDTEASWVLPFTPLSEKKAILASLDTFSDGGGTDLTKALEEVVRAFGHAGPVKRHVILLTDGQTGGEAEFFREFTQTMKAAQVSMTVLGIGNDINEALLTELAAEDGVFYRATGSDIPAILHKETVRMTRDLVQEGQFTPLVSGRDPALDLGTEPPPVLGYLVTRAKALARVKWGVERPDGGRDPLYADWRYGAGRVAVFASDSGLRWMTPWSGRPEYNRFWGQVVRSLETSARDKTLGLELSASAGVVRVVVEAIDKVGQLRTGATLAASHEGQTYPLSETGPGRYEATLPLASAGLQLVTVTEQSGLARTWGWVWNPAGAELAQGGADWAGLGRLSSGTGGLLQPLSQPAPPPPQWSWKPVGLRNALLGLAVVLFLIELGWRSLSLGQLASARQLFVEWWEAQSRPWSKPAAPSQPFRSSAESELRTREAYRYLAKKHEKKTPD